MTSAIRSFNYTNRIRIPNHLVSVRLTAGEGAPNRVTARLQPAGLDVPGDARLFLELFRRVEFQRIDCGSIADPRFPTDSDNFTLSTVHGVHARLKVVAPQGASAVRILALADGIEPEVIDSQGGGASLLPMVPSDQIPHLVWQLQLPDDGARPEVLVNRELVVDRTEFARSPAFVTLVLPEILRRLLGWSLENRGAIPSDSSDAARQWFLFAARLVAPPEVTRLMDTNEGPQARADWIDSVITRFCEKHKVAELFGQFQDQQASSGGERRE
jgi:hypothetical protein